MLYKLLITIAFILFVLKQPANLRLRKYCVFTATCVYLCKFIRYTYSDKRKTTYEYNCTKPRKIALSRKTSYEPQSLSFHTFHLAFLTIVSLLPATISIFANNLHPKKNSTIDTVVTVSSEFVLMLFAANRSCN